ncbi:hypothetical protein HYQ38_gp098 [Salmonella phage maane]|uniref:Uncharacterized protein n=1 Tax=Salmonella phage maane TaxID=2713304 RepID=A0A6G8RQL5_9CAUD|nr:hypothetical protein HYQ38_gp098 [Salmonella phage maane]QIO03505.1 hypothetical protein maane_98 [Salmonella phage maane]
MYLNTPAVLEATISFPIQGLAKSRAFLKQVPFAFNVHGERYPRSILRALRDALRNGAALTKEELRSKEVHLIDPELLSEEPELYQDFQNDARKAQLMFKKGDDALYVVDKGTNLPLVLFIK